MTERRSRRDYPDGVIGIYDNPSCIDRYTVVYASIEIGGQRYWPYLGMSSAPFHPQGFGQHGESRYRITGTGWGANGAGRCINFADLPTDCQTAVLNDLAFDEDA